MWKSVIEFQCFSNYLFIIISHSFSIFCFQSGLLFFRFVFCVFLLLVLFLLLGKVQFS